MKIGEVLEAGTGGFLAECYELYSAPAFGSLVRSSTGNLDVFAVVENTVTASREPGRLPVALGKHETSQEDIFNSHPQVAKLLRTCFKALVVGYREQNVIKHCLPYHTVRIHGFVFQCENSEVREFSRELDFLDLLVTASTESPRDELISACIRQMSLVQENQLEFLVTAGKTLTRLLLYENNRLNYLLRRIKP
ncbi:MAG: hypothetical protein Q8P44_00595 [Dehalococcoidia bacterium]|nr:hypothetical protein [Dehalococcoidia bacterium]